MWNESLNTRIVFSGLTPFCAAIALAVGLWPDGAAAQSGERISANAVSLNPEDTDYFGNFAPELRKTLDRVPPLDPETGLHVSEIKPGLFYVTEGVYQSAFLSTGEGVVVFDAPPRFAHKLPAIIRAKAPDEEVRYLIYSHDHTDHIGGASVFEDTPGLIVVAAAGVEASLRKDRFAGVLAPTESFESRHTIELGGNVIDLRTASFHSEDIDTIIYLPEKNFVMAVDTITPGEVPFMNFGATSDVGRYLEFFDTILAYDFDILLSGHVGILGSRDDVLEAKAYAFDVRDSVTKRMASFTQRFEVAFQAMGYKNPNLAYRVAMEAIRDECAAETIAKWGDRLSVVDVWADSHCETVLLYSIMH